MKLFGTVFFALAMFFLAYILLAGTPLQRINRACMPMSWVGRAMTTMASFGSAGAEAAVKESSGGLYEGCRVFIFRQFYAEELRALRERQAQSGQGVTP